MAKLAQTQEYVLAYIQEVETLCLQHGGCPAKTFKAIERLEIIGLLVKVDEDKYNLKKCINS